MFMSNFLCHLNGESIQEELEGNFKNTNLNLTEVYQRILFMYFPLWLIKYFQISVLFFVFKEF